MTREDPTRDKGTQRRCGPQARTRAAILAATASQLAAKRTATMCDIAVAATVGRTMLHRYFADPDRLIHEATLDAVRVLTKSVTAAATDQGPPIEALRGAVQLGSQSWHRNP